MFFITLTSSISRLAELLGAFSNRIPHLPLLDRYISTPRARVGRWGESVALRVITQAGLVPLRTNWRAQRGELDIIAFDRRTLVIIEVKTRHASFKRRYAAIQAVHTRKREVLAKTGRAFERNNGPLCRRYGVRHRRLDAIEVYYSRTRFGFLKATEVRWHRALASEKRAG